MTLAFVCNFMSVPRPGAECREFIWSEGRACRKCPAACYRAGMLVKAARADNQRIVEETRTMHRANVNDARAKP